MAAQGPDKRICSGCGAKLAANLRYCIYCYRPVSDEKVAHAHVESARDVDTTRRADPTKVFLPEEHEAIKHRARRRKRLAGAWAVAFVLAIAGLVTFYYLNLHFRAVEKAMAREQMARRELRLMADALERFRGDLGRYPTTQEGITSLGRRMIVKDFSQGEAANVWSGPYLDSVPEVDPWGNDYIYESTAGGQGFALFSFGPEGETGSGGQLQVTSPPPSGD